MKFTLRIHPVIYAEGYEERQKWRTAKTIVKGICSRMAHGTWLPWKEGQQVPEMNDAFVNSVTDRYIELYENITDEKFPR